MIKIKKIEINIQKYIQKELGKNIINRSKGVAKMTISNKEIKRRWEKSTKLKFHSNNLKNYPKILRNDIDCLAVDPVKGYLLMENDFFVDIGIKESFSIGIAKVLIVAALT